MTIETASPTHWVLTLSCPDRSGIVHAVAGALAAHGGNITESQQFGDPDSGLFFMRVQVEASTPRAELSTAIGEVARRFSMTWNLDEVGRPMRTLVLGSRTEHCVGDLLFRQRAQRLPVDILGVVSNHTTLGPLAEFYQVPFHHIPVTPDTKEAAEHRLLHLVREQQVELVVLARYMQILSPWLCEELAGQVINIHHSFLPAFIGAAPYRRAHERGVKLIGATSHYVTAELDQGPIIEQDVTRVDHSMTVADLQARGAEVERAVLARAVQWHAEDRVIRQGNHTIVFN